MILMLRKPLDEQFSEYTNFCPEVQALKNVLNKKLFSSEKSFCLSSSRAPLLKDFILHLRQAQKKEVFIPLKYHYSPLNKSSYTHKQIKIGALTLIQFCLASFIQTISI